MCIFSEYSQKYVNVAPASNVLENLNLSNYDYLETMELIDSGIDDTVKVLNQRMEKIRISARPKPENRSLICLMNSIIFSRYAYHRCFLRYTNIR